MVDQRKLARIEPLRRGLARGAEVASPVWGLAEAGGFGRSGAVNWDRKRLVGVVH